MVLEGGSGIMRFIKINKIKLTITTKPEKYEGLGLCNNTVFYNYDKMILVDNKYQINRSTGEILQINDSKYDIHRFPLKNID